MALLESLEIIGIRNFSPDEKHVVHFSTPVVLFQGQNGSGKTTLLESIRYGLTGELPAGTGTGAGFLNEPKMSGRSGTKGSVKVKFADSQGNFITICRVLQVQTQKNGNLQFKRLNHSIRKRDKDTNETHDISGRCVDIDSFCCNELNVSKSIFNNVLFCHQENSLWPLDEPKKLKEKFDEIFEAVRYNKCVDAIRKNIKDGNVRVKVLKERLDAKKYIKNEVEKKRAKFEDKKNKLKEIEDAIGANTAEIGPLRDRMREILDLEETLGTLQRQLSGKEEEKKGLSNQQKILMESMSYVFEGSDEELSEKINSFKEDQSSEEASIKQLEKKIQNITKQIENINLNIQRKQVNIGQMKEEQNQYKKKLEESQELINKLRLELDIEDFGDKEILLGELSNALKTQHKRFTKLKEELETEEKKLQEKIDRLREEHAKTKQSITSKNNTIKESNNKLKDIQYKLEELDTSDSQLKVVNDRIEKSQQLLAKIKNSFNENEKLQETEELKEQIDNKEQYLDKLDREYRILQRNYATEQKLESENSRIIEKQGLINKIKNKNSEHLKTLFKNDIPEKNLKKAVLIIQNQQEVEFRKRTKRVNDMEKELATLEATLNHQKNKLKNDQQELSTRKRKVNELCKDKDFSSVLEETYEKRERFQKKKGYLGSAKLMYEEYVRNIEDKKCCPVCQTNFEKNTSLLPSIIRDLKSKIVNIPKDLANTETEFKKLETLYNKLQQLKPINDDIQVMLKNKIPEMEMEIKNLTEKLEEKTLELVVEKDSINNPQKLIDASKSLISEAALFDQYQTDILTATGTIKDLEECIETVPSNRTRQETEMEIDSVKGELSNIKNRYKTNKDMLDQHRDRCQDLNKKIQFEVQKQIDIQKLVQEKPLLDKQNSEYQEQILTLTADIEELQLSLASQENDLKDAINDKNKITKTNRETQEKAQNKLMSFQNALSEIHKLEKGIQDYQRKDSSGILEKAVAELAELTVSLQNFEKDKSNSLSSISEKRESIAKKESEFRALKDNITLRDQRKQEEKVVVEIKALKQKIGGFNYRQVFEEKTKLTAKIDKKQRDINILNGQLEEIQVQHDELQFELEKPESKNAFNIYKKQYYEFALEKLIVKDFTEYVRVLERSVLNFHNERMIMINNTIKTLWRSIYRGNDIDYIKIKTDDSVGTNARRNYNYKVVQVKNGIELDMRGRCSAGQKVLACLVIRLALAETFSAHCGILALDEPTTNLDKANISSLCDALSDLINSRHNVKNFQLLIITHDEEFLKSLRVGQGQQIDSYWQVKRTPAGCSTVERQMM